MVETRACTFLVTLALSLGLVTGCSRGDARSADPAAPARGGELVASLRSEPGNYNRYFEPSTAAELVSLLTHARLVRIDRVDDSVQPALAERWTTTGDGRTVRLDLRRDVVFSDGAPFSSADVLFSFDVAYNAPGSVIGPSLRVSGQPLSVTAPGPHTVQITLPAPFAPGIRLLDHLPILPRHRLDAAYRAGSIQKAWTPAGGLGQMAGLGPFVLAEHTAGQRLVFTRNPHYWRHTEEGTRLPFLDRLVVQIIPDQHAEALRLESGATDLMVNGDIRPDDYARFKRLADQGRLRLLDVGVGLDPNVLWFNLKARNGRADVPFLREAAFRQALAWGIDRQAIANAVYLGAAVPISGPITPRNATWHSADAPSYSHDPARARQLLAGLGFADRNGDGMLETPAGAPVRFSVLVQQGVSIRERTVAIVQEQLRALGVAVDVVGLDLGSLFKRWQAGDYDAVFHGFQASATDPAMNLDFWLSSGSTHVWNPGQKAPATPWEARIDDLMRRQAETSNLTERQRLFAEVQRIFGEQLPALYLVAPKVTLATSRRVVNARPAAQLPQILWSADTLASGDAAQ